MAISNVPKNFRDGTLLIEDGTGTPIAVTVQYEAGDFSGSGFREGQTAVEMILDRGSFHAARKTNFEPPTFGFTANFTDLSDGTEKTLFDAINKTGAFAGGVSTLGANAEVWALKFTWTIAGIIHGDAADHSLVLENCVCSIDIAEGSPNNTFSISGTTFGDVTPG
jgi:hypothetical protein